MRGLPMARIVICDDDVQICRLLQLALRDKPYDVETVYTATDCRAACERDWPALLVTDISLPDFDGCELIRQLRAVCPKLPILAISGGTDDVLQAAWDSGADWVLRKPIVPALMVETADYLLSMHNPAP